MKTEPKRKSSKELFMKRYNLTPSQKNIDELQKFYKNTSISVLCGAVIFEKKLEKELYPHTIAISLIGNSLSNNNLRAVSIRQRVIYSFGDKLVSSLNILQR